MGFSDIIKKVTGRAQDQTASVNSTTQSSSQTSASNKLFLVAIVFVLIIAATLLALRTVSSNMRSVTVTPGDPNLAKTVKPETDKSSLLNSLQAEIDRQKLETDSVPADVNLIAKKWDYKPVGSAKRTKLAQQPPVDQPTVTVPAPPVVVETRQEPTKAVSVGRTPRRTRTRQGGKEKVTDPTQEVASSDDPFNTVHASSASTASPTAATKADAKSTTTDVRFIPAVIYGNQKIRTGGKARFRVTETVTFMGVHIPRNTIFTAIAYLGAGRLQFQMPAPMIAGQRLPADLMCLDKDYTMGITFNYDVVEDQIRQTSGNTASDVANAATSAMNYGGVVGQLGSSAIRGVAYAFSSGRRQRTISEVEILDGYHVFFKSTK